MEEDWRVLKDWPNYKISNYGQVYNTKRDRLLKTSVNERGYLRVNLNEGKTWKNLYLHHLVALAFVDGYFEEAEVKIIDGDRLNVCAWNLEWVTHAENVRHMFATGMNKGRGPGTQLWERAIDPDSIVPFNPEWREYLRSRAADPNTPPRPHPNPIRPRRPNRP